MAEQDMLMLQILGIPMDLGQQRRGVDLGPGALRYAGLRESLLQLGHTVTDRGNIAVPDRNEEQTRSLWDHEGGKLRHLPSVLAALNEIYNATRAAVDQDAIPIFLGGDHSISLATISALSKEKSVGVLWVDAHGDFNTPDTTPSGNIHGMPVAALSGLGHPDLVNLGHAGRKLQADQIVMIGIRDLDPAEQVALRKSGITVYTMRHIDELGIAAVVKQALAKLRHVDHLHVSLDMDSIDPMYAPGVGTPVTGGLSFREAHLLCELVAETNKLGSVDVVEVNPILDHKNNTAELGVALISSLFGKTIL